MLPACVQDVMFLYILMFCHFYAEIKIGGCRLTNFVVSC